MAKKKLNLKDQNLQTFVVEYENQSMSAHQRKIVGGYSSAFRKNLDETSSPEDK